MNVHQAVILAAGEGARLDRPDSPKPLVHVGHKPLILWNIEQLQDAGVTHMHVVIGARGEEIKKELTNNPSITATIEYIEQHDYTKKGMLASVLALKNNVHGAFYLTMADLVIEENPYHLFTQTPPADEKKIVSLIDARKEQALRSGALSKVIHKDALIKNIGRELENSTGVEVGIYLFGAHALETFFNAHTNHKEIDRFDTLLEKIASENYVECLEMRSGEWFDVNTPATCIRAEIFLRSKFQVVSRAKNINAHKEPSVDAVFYRNKELRSSIVIERGIIDRLAEMNIVPKKSADSPLFLITDSTVDALYGDRVLSGLTTAGYAVKKIVLPPGEETKSATVYSKLAEELFFYGIDEQSALISLGGGVINNLVGFLASTLYRGIGLIHIATTMMAQVDAAIDFKQAINSAQGKNLVGSYHAAHTIVVDPTVLSTLSERHINNGIAESLKHALAQDKEFFDYLMQEHSLRDIDFLENVIKKTIELKVPLLNGDPKNEINEMIPQYGHSVGHAIEYLSGYELLHGEAVAVGMCVSAEIAKLLGFCDQTTVDAHYTLCKKYNLPVKVPATMTSDDITNVIRFDKHYLKGNPRMALVDTIGSVWNDRGAYSVPIDYAILKRAIDVNKTKHE